MDMGLKNKVAIVTGGSEGIGRAAATSLAREGARVVICARRKDNLENAAAEISKETGGRVIGIPADVTKPEDIQALVDKTVETFGRLDIVVNNAGVPAGGNFENLSDEGMRLDMDLKFYAAVRVSRAAIPHMKKQGGGRIINVTAIAGKQPGANSMPTSISRAAGLAFTKALSKDMAKYNILVNTVCIGNIKSNQTVRRAEAARARDPNAASVEQMYAEAGKAVPLGRIGEGPEAGDVICFLASDRASYLTGTAVNVDGGLSAVL